MLAAGAGRADRQRDARRATWLVRLKYGGVDPAGSGWCGRWRPPSTPRWPTAEPGGTLYVLPTYTAMLELRAELARRGLVAPFWED